MKSSAAYGVSDKTFSFKKYHKIFWEKMSYKDPSGVEGIDITFAPLSEMNLKMSLVQNQCNCNKLWINEC